LQTAVERLGGLGRVVAVSSVYETEPVGVAPQPRFLNCAVALETEMMPKQLLARTRRIEEEMGRRRASLLAGYRTGSQLSSRKAPRALDIDILLFGHTVMDTPTLTIPHPAMHERRFVLEPLAEIAPEARHPVFNITVRHMRDHVLHQKQVVRKTGAEPLSQTTTPFGQ